MEKTRLNQHHRDLLRKFAGANIACPREQKARDRAYAKAAKLVSEAAAKLYPASDMAILAKYDASHRDSCIRGGAPDGRFVGFQFDANDPLIPILPTSYCSSRAFSWTAATADAIGTLEKAQHALKTARDAKLNNYRSLILTARTFEEVIAVWPAAEALREAITRRSTALVALSDEVRQFIGTDNAGADAVAQAA